VSGVTEHNAAASPVERYGFEEVDDIAAPVAPVMGIMYFIVSIDILSGLDNFVKGKNVEIITVDVNINNLQLIYSQLIIMIIRINSVPYYFVTCFLPIDYRPTFLFKPQHDLTANWIGRLTLVGLFWLRSLA